MVISGETPCIYVYTYILYVANRSSERYNFNKYLIKNNYLLIVKVLNFNCIIIITRFQTAVINRKYL